MKDRNIAAKTAREIRLPVVLKYWCQHKSSYAIVPFVAAECGQNVNARTIQRDLEQKQTPTNSFSSSMTPDNVRKTKVLAEIREWEKMRNALMGIDVKHIDIKSDGKSFTGFASVLPVVPNIEQIIAQVDARRRENADEGDN